MNKIKPQYRNVIAEYMEALDKHLADIVEGRELDMLEINEIAGQIHIHPTYLSNLIKAETGKSACYFYQEKILNIAKSLLEQNEKTVKEIAFLLTYDPSNFNKLFKTYLHQTPKQYRDAYLKKNAVGITNCATHHKSTALLFYLCRVHLKQRI